MKTNDTYNTTRQKKCPLCGNWFEGDETANGEICKNCSEAKRNSEEEVKMGIREILRSAMGRGYCTNENSGEDIDATLIEAMLTEIISVIKNEVMKCKLEISEVYIINNIVEISNITQKQAEGFLCLFNRILKQKLTKLFEEKKL